jgi:hypothetical protein
MKTIQHLISLAAMLATALLAPAAVPSAINYQGRLTNASGVPQTGSKAMSLKIYDAATSGTLLYAETLGSVAVDANGVYGFQFGASGTSDTLVTETLATTDGTALTYQKALSNTPVVAGTVSVTDGTYSWNELTGNPGSPASATATIVSGFVVGATVTNGGSGYTSAPSVTITGNGSNATATATVSSGAVTAINITNAGSGYTTGATITIASPPAPFVVNYSGGTITATYATAPAAGQSITATYRYSANGISGALAAGSEQWLELTVDGVAQSPRQRVLAVPFAQRAAIADSVSSSDPILAANIQDLGALIQRVNMTGVEFPDHLFDTTSGNIPMGQKSTFTKSTATASWDTTTSRYLSKVNLTPAGSGGTITQFFSNSIDAFIARVTGRLGSMPPYYDTALVRLVYIDGTSASMTHGAGNFDFVNPNPDKYVKTIEFSNTSNMAGITVFDLRIYPVPNQERRVDINLSSFARTASYVSLVTNSIDQSAISYSILNGQWASEKFSTGIKHQIPQGTSITGLRIFLNYPPGTEDLSGADLQAYSLRCWK